ncbi:unnamed protein product [Auanema sp. JU1783]|nr:unnamed protein product [Auanema sp. JU1783]
MSTLTICHECGMRMPLTQTSCTVCGSEFVEVVERRSNSNRSRESSRARRTRRVPPGEASEAPRRQSNPRSTNRSNPIPPTQNTTQNANANTIPPTNSNRPSNWTRVPTQRPNADPNSTSSEAVRDQSVVANVVNNVLRALSATVASNTFLDVEGGRVTENTLNMGPITLEVQMTGSGERQIRLGTEETVLNSMDRIMQDLFHVVDQPLNGLSDQQLRSIPIIEVTENHVKDETQCSTCLDLFKLGESVAQLNCMHIFHQQCVEPWLKQQRSCPICRQRVNPQAWNTSSPVPRSAGERNLSDLEDLD